MATGITRNKWTSDTHIVSKESFDTDVKFRIEYQGKTPEKEMLSGKPSSSYKYVYGQGFQDSVYYGDNQDVLRHLLHIEGMKGKIKLVYIDPPYGTNSVFQSRNQKSSYRDDLTGSHYLEFMRRRLILLRELLSKDGSIYVHLDGNMAFQVKVLMDEVFGPKNFRGFITRKKCSNKNSTKKTFGNISDYILFYSKSDKYTWIRATEPWSEQRMKKEYPCIDATSGRRFKKVPIHAPGERNGETGKEWKGMLPPPGKHWQYTPARLTELDENGEIYWSSNGNPRRKIFFDADKGIPVQDIWMDVQDSLNQNVKITGYPTEKNPFLLERIIQASSNPGDIVLDCFCGSGTTIDVANQLGRRFIGIDNSTEAIRNIVSRMVKGVDRMGDYVTDSKSQKKDQVSIRFEKEGYDPDASGTKQFSLLADTEYSELISTICQAFGLD